MRDFPRRFVNSVRRAGSYTWRERGDSVVRGLAVGVVLGFWASLLTHNWSVLGWFGCVGAGMDVGLTFSSRVVMSMRGQDCEWLSHVYPSQSQVRGVILELVRRDGRSWSRFDFYACVVRDPSGREARREGARTSFTFIRDFPDLGERQLGRHHVAWLLQTGKGKWLPLLRDYFDLDEGGYLREGVS